jgi:hypothetical protein
MAVIVLTLVFKPRIINKKRNVLTLATNSMEHSPSWEANSRSTSPEILRLLWIPSVHYRVQKNPPLDPIKYQMTSGHTLKPCLRKILILSYYVKSRDSSVGIALGYGLDYLGSRVRFPVGAENFLSSPPRPERLWGPLSLLSNGYQGFFPWG